MLAAALGQTRSAALLKTVSRSMSRARCNKDGGDPRCSAKNLAKTPCGSPPPVEKSMWDNPECCLTQCPEVMPRFDELYYKRTDKTKRCYSQTWVEAPPPIKKIKLVCTYDESQLPPIQRRPRNQRPQTACNMKARECGDDKNLRCIRIVLPNCRSRRNSFHCLVEKNPRPLCPKRDCAPYPSFSECARAKEKARRRVECRCVYVPAICEIWKELEQQLLLKQQKKG